MRHIIDEGLGIEKFHKPIKLEQEKIDKAIEDALNKIDLNLNVFSDKFPGTYTVNNVYSYRDPAKEDPTKETFMIGENFGWTTGFWTGMLWLAYELTGKKKYKDVAEIHVESFIKRINQKRDVDTHDLGFLYTLSCIACYSLTGNKRAKNAALQAADHLLTRYFKKAKIIQAHGDLNNERVRGKIIIDCLMNLPLLYWATEQTGLKKYREAAINHALKTMEHNIRVDASTYHSYYFDPDSGNAKYGETLQGYSDDSCWSRGQAWGIYGFLLSYIYTDNTLFLSASKKLANYFLNRSPQDYVVYWDLIFAEESNEEKDSSASAITVCALLELVKHVDNIKERNYYYNAANYILNSLIDNYSTIGDSNSNALLKHGVFFKKQNRGVNEASLYGDYFYLEALVRLKMDWDMFW